MALLLHLLIGVLLVMTPNATADKCAMMRRSANNCVVNAEVDYAPSVNKGVFCKGVWEVVNCLEDAIDQCPSLESEFGPVKQTFDYVIDSRCLYCTEERDSAYDCFAKHSIDFERANNQSYRETLCRQGWKLHYCLVEAVGQCYSVRQDLDLLWNNIGYIMEMNNCPDPCRLAQLYVREVNNVANVFQPSPRYCGVYKQWHEDREAAKAECPRWTERNLYMQPPIQKLLSVCNDTSEIGNYTFQCPDNKYLFIIESTFCNVLPFSLYKDKCGWHKWTLDCYTNNWEQCKLAGPAWVTPDVTTQVKYRLKELQDEGIEYELECREEESRTRFRP